jgi:tRNA A22 N-methylase
VVSRGADVVYDACVMRELSARLEAIVQALRPCRLLADIGTDHGLVPIAAVLRGVAESAIASDMREAPLRVARRNIARARLEGRVTIAQGDGLAELAGRGIDTIVLAGMSGELAVRLCSATPDVLRSTEQLVLQPNRGVHVVRSWARGAGWHLRDERLVASGGQFFAVCASGPCSSRARIRSRCGGASRSAIGCATWSVMVRRPSAASSPRGKRPAINWPDRRLGTDQRRSVHGRRPHSHYG